MSRIKSKVLCIILSLVFAIAMCVAMVSVTNAETLVQTEKFELHNHLYKIGGVTVLCHWIQNPKLLSGKVNTGLSCFVLDPTPVVVYKCDDKNHTHPQYESPSIF